MRKKKLKLGLVLILACTVLLTISFAWVKTDRGGVLAYPANGTFILFPRLRTILRHYRAGDLAPNYLRAKLFNKLIIEIDYLTGYKPDEKDLEWLADFMKDFLDKPNGIEVIFSDQIQGTKEHYTLQEIRQIEIKHRSFKDKEDTATLYFLFLNLYADETFQAMAFNGSSAAFFVERIQKLDHSQYPFISSIFRQNILRHELGHILGLVNNSFWGSKHPEREFGKRYFGIHETYFRMPFGKVKPGSHPHHSKNPKSVMSRAAPFYTDSQLEYFLSKESESLLKTNQFDQKSKQEIIRVMKSLDRPITFDEDDIDDLDAIRGYEIN